MAARLVETTSCNTVTIHSVWGGRGHEQISELWVIKLRPKTALNEEMICGWVSENGSGSIGSTADDPDLSASDDEAETGGRVYFTDWTNRVSSSDNLVAIAEEAQLSDTGSSDGVDDVSGDEEGGEVGLDSFELGRIVRDIETMALHGLSDNASASPPTLNGESEVDGINFKARQAPETALSQKPLTYGSKGASLSSNFADEEVLKINGPTEENLSEVTLPLADNPLSIPDRGKKAKTRLDWTEKFAQERSATCKRSGQSHKERPD